MDFIILDISIWFLAPPNRFLKVIKKTFIEIKKTFSKNEKVFLGEKKIKRLVMLIREYEIDKAILHNHPNLQFRKRIYLPLMHAIIGLCEHVRI